MIDKLSRKLTQKLIDSGIIAFDDWEVYMYGLQMLIFGAVKLVGFMLIAWVLGWLAEAFVFITVFSLLRVYAGGYHEDTYLKCFLMTSGVTFLSIWIVKNYFINESVSYTAIILSAASVLVFIYAPVDSPGKRMIGKEKAIFRARSLAVLLVETSVIIAAYVISPKMIVFCNIAAIAMLFEAITLTPIVAGNNIKEERRYCNEE